MMKKNGFTLAEVLITLAIIGVVATLTLPALMTNTAEQQAKTALKKGINTLTEAAQMNQAIAGFDYASLTVNDTTNQESQSLYGLLSQRASVDFQKTDMMSNHSGYTSHQGNTEENGNFAVFFRDGSALLFPESTKSTEGNSVKDGTEVQSDGLVYGIAAIYDTNGLKGPNILSNCRSDAMGAAEDNKQPIGTKLEDYCTPKTRVIKDQFGVRLRGGYAVPNGAAARWAFEN